MHASRSIGDEKCRRAGIVSRLGPISVRMSFRNKDLFPLAAWHRPCSSARQAVAIRLRGGLSDRPFFIRRRPRWTPPRNAGWPPGLAPRAGGHRGVREVERRGALEDAEGLYADRAAHRGRD